MRKHILYLASGSSRRFGGNKLLHSLEGKPLFLWGLEAVKQVTDRRKDCGVTVVSRYAAIREKAEAMGFRAVDSPDSEKGVSYTIRAGIQSLEAIAPEDFLLFLVADQPYLTSGSLERLMDQADRGTECACLCWGARPGNPTLFSARLIPELLALEGDTGGRSVLRRHDCAYVSAEMSRELEDIDVPGPCK